MFEQLFLGDWRIHLRIGGCSQRIVDARHGTQRFQKKQSSIFFNIFFQSFLLRHAFGQAYPLLLFCRGYYRIGDVLEQSTQQTSCCHSGTITDLIPFALTVNEQKKKGVES